MRILFLTQILPYPLHGGANIRAYFMLKYLAQKHDVTLVSFVRADDKPQSIVHLQTICSTVHTVPMRRSMGRNVSAVARGLLYRRPLVISRDDDSVMYRLIRQLVGQMSFDVVHADQTAMAGYGLYAAQHAPNRILTILDQHNAVYKLSERMAREADTLVMRTVAQSEARAFRRYERQMCQRYDAVLTVTDVDKHNLLALFHESSEHAAVEAKMLSIPICVDVENILPITPQAHSASTILHVGTMFWPPNVQGIRWFIQEVMPLIWQVDPTVQFTAIGKNPPDAVQALGEDDRITITGYVADLQPYLATSDLFVIPLQVGGGMRVKLIDAWRWGLPIVSTTIGAEGICYEADKQLLIADSAQEMATAALTILSDPHLAQSLRCNGRQWVEHYYDWRIVYKPIGTLYEQIVMESKEPRLLNLAQ